MPARRKIIAVLALAVVLGLLFWMALKRNTTAVDWNMTYYPATRAFIQLDSPYKQAPLFFAPVWSLVPLVPFALLPPDIGGALFFVVSLLGFAYLGYKAGCRPVGVAALLLSAPVANCIQTGNVEWLSLLGAFVPPPLGLILLSTKPQATIGIMVFILFEASKQGLTRVLKVIAPTVILFAASCLAYGGWFLRIGGAFQAAGEFVVSAWPFGVPIGVALLALALRRQKIDLAFAASPLLSPYAILLTWSGFVLSFAKSTRAMVLISVLNWIFWIAFRIWR